MKTSGRFARASACFALEPTATAACEIDIDNGDKGDVRVGLPNGRYPPTPYAIVGLPSLVWSSKVGVYLMRAVGAVLCGALFASALLSLRETRMPWLAASGLAFALTPMVLFLASVVNPSNLEIAGGVALWASGVVLISRARDGVVDSRVVARTAIAAVVLVLARPLGMVWLGIAGIVLLSTGTAQAFRRLLRSRVVQIWGGVVGLCVAVELAWITYYDSLGSKVPPGVSAEGLSDFEVIRETLGSTPDSYRQMVGVFGWIDTPPPVLTLALWTAALGVLVVLALVLANRRMAALIAALLGLIVLVPAVLEFIEAKRFGFGWQGRYTLPFAVGLPILCACAAAQEFPRIRQRRRLAVLLGSTFGTIFVAAHFAAFAQSLRRYTVGHTGTLLIWRDPAWSPPLSPLMLVVAYAVLLVAIALWFWSSAATETSDAPSDASVTTSA